MTRRRPPRTHVDQSVPGTLADVQPEADPEAVARSILLRRLTMSPRSRAELASDLASRGIPDDVAVRVLDRFEQVGLIDDAGYAAVVVRSRHEVKGLSRRAVAGELRRRGVDDDVAEAALAEVTSESEEAAARRVAERKARSMRGLDTAILTRRLAGMLARRGYSAGLSLRVARETASATRGDTVVADGLDTSLDAADLADW